MIFAMFIFLVLITVFTSIMFGYFLGRDNELKDTIEDLKANIRDKKRKKREEKKKGLV